MSLDDWTKLRVQVAGMIFASRMDAPIDPRGPQTPQGIAEHTLRIADFLIEEARRQHKGE